MDASAIVTDAPELPGLERQLPTPAPKPPSPVSVEGHRQRLRSRLLSAGPDAMSAAEVLELVLFLALPRRDTKPLVRELLARFGSLAGVAAAPFAQLLAVEGLGEAGAAAIKTVDAASRQIGNPA